MLAGRGRNVRPCDGQFELRGAHGLRLRRLHGLHAARRRTAPSASARTGRCSRRRRCVGEHTGHALRLDAGQPRHPRQRHLRLRLRVRRAVRHQRARHLLLQGHDAAQPRFGNPDAAHRRRARPACSTPWACKTPAWTRSSPRSCPRLKQVLSQAGDRQRQRLFRGGIRRTCARSWTAEAQVGLHRGEHLLPQRPRRRHGLRHRSPERPPRSRARSRPSAKKPVYMKLTPNVDRHRRQSRAPARTAGADGICLINTLLGMRIDPRRAPARPRQHHGRPLRPRGAARWRCAWSGRCTRPCTSPSSAWAASSAEDVMEMMLAGATAVEVGAANLVNPLRLPGHRPRPARGHGAIRHR